MESYTLVLLQNHATGDYLVSDGLFIHVCPGESASMAQKLWKMIDHEPGVCKLQEKIRRSYLQVYQEKL